MFRRCVRDVVLAAVCLLAISAPVAAQSAGDRAPEAIDPSETGVTARYEPLTLPWWTSEARHEQPGGERKNSAMFPVHGTKQAAGPRTFQTVILENRHLRVQVGPELGGAVVRAVHQRTGDDLFYREKRAKDWLPFWESGVKASFPFREHGMATDQRTGYHVIDTDAGGKAVVMWMAFAHHNQPHHRWQFGRYSDMLLSQRVTLEPQRGTFAVTYRLTNPTPWKQGVTLWNDALFPKCHDREGIVQADQPGRPPTDVRLIYPTRWISGHNGDDRRPLTEKDRRVAARPEGVSYFAWDSEYGFAGLWYPQARVNRLRLNDPDRAPGAKFWWGREAGGGRTGSHNHNYIELWGGPAHVFEGVERWIQPGETYTFTHRFTMLHDMGEVDFADERFAVSATLAAEQPFIELAALRPVGTINIFNGFELLDRFQPDVLDPQRIDLPAGADRLTLRIEDAAGRTLVQQKFPVTVSNQQTHHEAIRTAVGREPVNHEMNNVPMAWGRSMLNAHYPDGTLGAGRVALKRGHIDAAIKHLREATDQSSAEGEAWHLLGVAHLEAGDRESARNTLRKAVDAGRPYPAARFYLAILADDRRDRLNQLEKLLAARPDHWEARLLQAWLLREDEPERSADLIESDPADPRAWFVRMKSTESAGGPAHDRAVRILERLREAPGADFRIEQFLARTRGEYLPAPRLGER